MVEHPWAGIVQKTIRTSNVERRTLNVEVKTGPAAFSFDVRRSTFDVRRSHFLHSNSNYRRKSTAELQPRRSPVKLYHMTTTAPPPGPKIYTGRLRSIPVPIAGRLMAAGIAAACLSVLIVACGLSPNTGGFGTHRQLGLAECGFLARTGLPCPACGMTTSFAWFAHGNLLASFYIQPMGMILAGLCGMCVWGAGYVAVTGRPVHRILSVFSEKIYLYPLLAMAIIGWGWKMYIHLHGIDGWR
jgi:hypothetical protein